MTQAQILTGRMSEKLMLAFLQGPGAKAAQAEADAEIATERKNLGARWQRADDSALAAQQPFEAHRAAEVEKLTATEKALREGRGALAAKLAAHIGTMHQFSVEKQQCENALEESSAPAIHQFLIELADTLEALRNHGLRTTMPEAQQRLFGAPAQIIWTNVEALNAAMARIKSAQVAARELLLLPDQTKIEEQIAKLRKHVGDLTNLEMVERVIERPVFVREVKT